MKGWKLFIPLLILAIVAITLYLRLYNPPLLLQGEVDTTNVIVASKAKGRVQVLHVRRGDDFRQGDLLISLDSPELEAQLEILRAARNEAQAQLNESLHGTREENIRVLQASLAQAQAELRNAEQNFQRNRQILDRGFLSRTQFDLARRERDMALNRVAAAKANLDESLKGDRKERRQALQAAVRRADAQLAELQAQLDDLQVRAPVDGEVGPIPAEQGELVNAYSPLLTLVRLNDSYFVFKLREDILAKVRKGDHITLKIPGLGGSQVEVELRYIAPLGDFSTKCATRATGDFDLKTFEVRFYPIQPAGTYGVGRTEAMLWVVLKRNGNRFLQTFSTETRIACRSWTIHWLGWCWPLLLFGLISGIYQAGTLLDMPVAVAVVDKDHSALSRRLIRELDAISHAQVIEIPDGMPAALGAIRRADAYALLYIPPDFEADVFGGRVPKAELYYNALLYAAGYAATQDFSALVADFNGELRLQLAAGMPALPHLTNISVSYDSLFNASGNYIYYQQFAAIVHLLQLFVIVTMVHVLAREAPELRTSSPHILRAQALGVRLLGKLAPYTLLFSTLLMLQIFLLVVFSGAKINGSPLWMLMITFFYVIAAQSIGLILFVFTANRFTAYSLIGMLISIAQTYSGVLIPELAMPALARVIAEAEPLTHTLHGLFDQFLRQAPDNSALYTCAKLALYPLIAYTIAKQRLRSRLDLSPI